MAYPMYQQNYPQYPVYPQYQPQVMQQAPAQQTVPQTQAQPQIQNGGFVQVHNEDEARNWPVAPGNSVTFIDENAAFVYTKTASYNQFDRPQFVKYRLEQIQEQPQNANNGLVNDPGFTSAPVADYALKSDVEAINAVMSELKNEMEEFRSKLAGFTDKKSNTRKKEEPSNE